LELARQALLEDGLVVLDDLIPVEIIDTLADLMYAEVDAFVAAHDQGRQYRGQLNQPPPTAEEHLYPEVMANPLVLQLCRSLLGPSVASTFYTSNVNVPGSDRQRVHCDLPQLWPDLNPVHTSPYGIICNLPLIDTTEGNATELWPGTHLDGRTNTRDGLHRDIPFEWLEERQAVRPPVQIPQTKGSAIVRDLRVWHTGVANTSNVIRIMLGVGYAPAWYNGFVIPVPAEVAAALARFGVPFAQAGAGGLAFMHELAESRRASRADG
jgi:ectoine hydroxylase-related dioxygenase (phytanoyl-CoA dioxygenase family)